MSTLAIVEDDEVFGAELAEFLGRYGYEVSWMRTLSAFEALAEDAQPDILVLDQFTGGRDAIPALQAMRARFHGGIIILTGNVSLVDRIVALEAGADDFVLKSAGPRELLARLRSVERRTIAPSRGERPIGIGQQPGHWVIDGAQQFVQAPDGTMLQLTATELCALMYMDNRASQIISRDELSLAILGRRFSPFDRSVDNMLSRIRRVIAPHLGGKHVLRSVRGQGYVFTGIPKRTGNENTAPHLARIDAEASVA